MAISWADGHHDVNAPVVIFDLDGTLVDTAPDLLSSLNHTVAREGLSPVEREDINHLVGQGARVMIEKAYALKGASLSPDRLDRLLTIFIDHYLATMPGRSQPYPGLIDALDRLTRSGFTLAVCTNKLERLARPLLAGLNLERRFAAVTGGDTIGRKKPHPDHIHATVSLAGGQAGNAIMIGDSKNDIEAARAAGIASIAVDFGYSDIPASQLGASAVMSDYDELTSDLVRHLIATRTSGSAEPN